MTSLNSTQSYDLHGITLAISSDSAVASALHSRLSYFARSPSSSPDLTFEFYSVPAGQNHIVEKPSEPTRPVYDPPLGEVVYAANTDRLYINYDDRIRVLCDLSGGRARLSALASGQTNFWLLTHPLFTLPLLEFLKRRAYYPLHAAALALEGKCVLFPGTSGAGKSTLTLALLRAGFDFLSDDLVFLKHAANRLHAFAFPEELDLTDETVRLFPELTDLLQVPPPLGGRKRQVSAEKLCNAPIANQALPSLLVFPHVANADKSVLAPLPSDEAFLELVPNVMLTEAQSSQAHLNILAALVKQCACYRLETGRDFDTLPLLLRELLASGAV